MKLTPHPSLPAPHGPLVLLILDGVGIGQADEFDAVACAATPTLDALGEGGLARQLRAHGTAVGLPSDADMGNSEVGHNILGAGRIFDQGAKLVDAASERGTIWNGTWQTITRHLQKTGGALHLIGLVSDGNVHSHEKQLFALIGRAAAEALPRLYVHALQDGRDVPETSALVYIDRLEDVLAGVRETGKDYWIASGGGRMTTTMDRYEADWAMVERGWKAQVHGIGRAFPSARSAIETYRQETPGIADQFLPEFVVSGPDGRPRGPVQDGDAVIFFNFRGDRGLEISQAFEAGPEFDKFDRGRVPQVLYAGMMLYDGDLHLPRHYLVSSPEVERPVSEYLAHTGVRQLACSETQKFGHVTYFWNGNRSGKFDEDSEEYIEIPSDQVPFDEAPWMKSAETAQTVIQAIHTGDFPFIRVNFAAGDMVGHTGKIDASIAAVEEVDRALGRILPEVLASKGCLVVTADHGNAEDMVQRDPSQQPLLGADGRPQPRTSHSLNPVPFFVVEGDGRVFSLRDDLPGAGLANVAATLLELLGYQPPEEFEPSLLKP